MNNTDISNMINMLQNMDKNKLATGVEQLNKMLNTEDKQKLMQMLNNMKK